MGKKLRARQVQQVRAQTGQEEAGDEVEPGLMTMSQEALAERIAWMAPLPRSAMAEFDEMEGQGDDEGTRVLPFFPLGVVSYLPGTNQVLNIFEPRYRAMYNDILFNGSRQFVVSMVSQFDNRFAEVGVVFYLEDLKEVSEQTGDRIKFICSHKVIGRVKINKVINPDAWTDRTTYLKARVQDIPDTDADVDCTEEETKLAETFENVMTMQAELGMEPRFTEELRGKLVLGRGDDDGLWLTVALWQEFSHQRLVAIQNEANRQIQELLIPFMKQEERTASGQYMVNFETLPEDIKSQLKQIQDQNNDDMKQLMSDPYMPFQLIIQEDSHMGRLKLLTSMVEEEQKVLQARVALKSLFK